MSNSNKWWEYYGLKDEPNLSIEPLTNVDELNLFYGREDEITALELKLNGRYKKTLLLTGDSGVGKSSLINKLFNTKKGYVHVNLSNTRKVNDFESVITKAFIDTIEKINPKIAEEYRERYMLRISETLGNNRNVSIGYSGTGVARGDTDQTTYAPDRKLEVAQIINEVIEEISKIDRVCLVLDESDFFDNKHADELIHLSHRMKDELPSGTVLILVNRDSNNYFKKQYRNTTSLVRSTFQYTYHIHPLWKSGEADIPKIFEERFKTANPTNKFTFPLSIDSCRFLDKMASGNLRSLIQYTEHALMYGAVKNESIPLNLEFVQKETISNFEELSVLDDQEKNVLQYLLRNPTHLSGLEIQELYARATLQRIRDRLLDRMLIYVDTEDSSGKHILIVTELGQLLLNNVFSE